MTDDGHEYDDGEMPEGAEWCDRCQGSGITDCRCGGDQCYCRNGGEMDCPTCHGEGFWTPTPAQLEARAKHAEWMQDWWARMAKTDDERAKARTNPLDHRSQP